MKLRKYIIAIAVAAVVLMVPLIGAAESSESDTSMDLSGIKSYGHFVNNGDLSYFKYNDTSVLVDEEETAGTESGESSGSTDTKTEDNVSSPAVSGTDDQTANDAINDQTAGNGTDDQTAESSAGDTADAAVMSARTGTAAGSGADTQSLRDRISVYAQMLPLNSLDTAGTLNTGTDALSLRLTGSTKSKLPSSYDLRTKGRVTPVRNQGKYNTCAAFATLASLESNLVTRKLANKKLNLSELHLSYFTFHGKNGSKRSLYDGKDSFYSSKYLMNGSNYMQTIATLARWYGSVPEKTAPYSKAKKGLSGKLRTRHNYLLTNAYFQPDYLTSAGKINKKAMNQIKAAIRSQGAVASMMCVDEGEGFGTSTASKQTTFFWPLADDPDHGITIVGWNDKYSSNNFVRYCYGYKCKPNGNGAWLVKNSWGTKANNKGYFWISYYDPSLFGFYSMIGDKKKGGKAVHQSLYQYDGLGFCDSAGFTGTKVSGANCFKARKDTLVTHVSTWTLAANSRVNVKIYVTKYNTPTSGTRLYNKTFKVAKAGYHTLSLGKKVGIPKGCNLCVVVTTKVGKYYFVPFEIIKKTGSSAKISKKIAGESYMYGKMVKKNKYKWVDTKYIGYVYMNSDTGKATVKNALAKAHSVDSGKKAQKIKVRTKRKIKKKKSFRLKAKRLKGNGRLVYYSSNKKIATVNTKGKVRTKKKGKVKIYVRALPTAKYKSAVRIVKVTVK